MNESQMDDVLRQLHDELAAIEPSSDFAARVRARVAEKRGWSWVWMAGLAAATAGAAALAMLVVHRPASRSDIPRVSMTSSVAPVAVDVPKATISPSATDSSHSTGRPEHSERVRGDRGSQRQDGRPIEAQVLVPADQLQAIRALLASVRERGTATVPVTPNTTDETTGELLPLKPIEIPLLSIEPLPGDPEGRSGGSKHR